MELRDWLVLIIIPTTAAVFAWYTGRYLPTKQAKEKQEREFSRASESESLSQVIKINETIISALIRIIDSRFSRVEDSLDRLQNIEKELQAVGIHVEAHKREVIRNNEVQSDIDLLLHEIKMLVVHHNELFHSEIEVNEKTS
jgi:hypothetical protein